MALDLIKGHYHFGHIGKNSPAHYVGLETLRGKRAPDETITTRELLGLLGEK